MSRSPGFCTSCRTAVLAERHPDTEIDSDLLEAMAFDPYDGLVEAVCGLVAGDARREAPAETGLRCMRGRDTAEVMPGAVGIADLK